MGISIQDLLKFCTENSLYNYETKEKNGIRVSIPSTFAINNDEYDDHYLPLGFMACHTEDNLNGSYIAEETMEAALPSFAEKPILAAFVEVEDENGEKTLDFNGHDMIVTQDKLNNGTERVEYIEQIVGIIPKDNNIKLVEDESTGKKYVSVNGLVFREYTYAADILEKRGTVDVSVELNVKKFSFDAQKKMITIDEFTFFGVTLLGSHVNPGMAGAHASVQTFENQSGNEMKEILSQFQALLTDFKHQMKEGGKMKVFEQLLEKYNITAEDVQFEIEGMTDEEMEAKFAEVFETEEVVEEAADNVAEETEEVIEDVIEESEVEEVKEEVIEEPVPDYSNKVISFEISHDDIRHGLYDLLSAENEENYWYSYIITVYDNHFIYHNYNESKYFDQKYVVDGDSISFEGDRVEVFSLFVTEEEKNALDLMRATYDELKSFKEKADYEAEKSKKEEILNDEKFSILENNEEFSCLKNEIDNYTVTEVEEKAKTIFSNYVYENPAVFTTVGTKASKGKIGFSEKTSEEQSRYGNLFNSKN